MARNAILFWLTILFAVFAGIYFRGYKDKEKIPLIVHKDWANCVQPTVDGGYVIAGVIWGMGGMQSAVYLLKTDPDGREIWHKTFGERYGDHGFSVEQTGDGGYIVVGNTWLVGRIGQSRIYLLRTDGKGGEVWVKTFGGEGSAYGHSVCRTTDGGYIVAGKTEDMDRGDDDICLIKTYSNGSLAWRMTGTCPD